MELKEIRHLVSIGRYSIRPHVIQHGLKEGFSKEYVIEAIINGREIERYQDRCRLLIYGRPYLTERVKLDLHVVCDYFDPTSVDIVTAYIPDLEEWETPFQRKRKRR